MNILKNILTKQNSFNLKGIVIPKKITLGTRSQIFKNNKFFIIQVITLEEKLKNKIKCEKLEVEDISGNCGTSFSIKLTSPDFKGKSIIMQHRMVNDALKEEMKEIHALQIKSEASK